MKICFIGLGSIGTRHLKNIAEILEEKGLDYSIDALRTTYNRLDKEVAKYIHGEFHNIEDLPVDYDVAFITNPTCLHYTTILSMQERAKHLFIEKPVFDKISYDINQLKREGRVFYVACPLRYTNVIQYLKKYLVDKNIYSVRVICSSYLPEWRKDVDYRKTYSAQTELGGGVSIDLIHEWDYLVYLFGLPEKVFKIQGKYSNLEIDSEDLAIYLARYKDKLVNVHLDYFGRFHRREIEIYTDKDVIVGDLINNKIKFLKEDKEVDVKEERNEFQKRELKYFLSIIEGSENNINSIGLALDVLKITKGEL